jgi:hypothetical protein
MNHLSPPSIHPLFTKRDDYFYQIDQEIVHLHTIGNTKTLEMFPFWLAFFNYLK